MFIRTETKEDKDKWIRALELHIDLVRGGSGSNLIQKDMKVSSKKKKIDRTLETEFDRVDVLLQQVSIVESSKKRPDTDPAASDENGSDEKDDEKTPPQQDSQRDIIHSIPPADSTNDVYDVEEGEVYQEEF